MKTFNLQNWKFNMESGHGEPGADPWAPSFDDSRWKDVVVPHDWAVTFPFDRKWSSGTGYLPGGTGWYRSVFQVPEGQDGKPAFVYFDGIYKNSRVWCNGYYLGKRPSGYTGFRYDISHCLRSGDNVIAVQVSHEDIADSRWYTGSGIYRKAGVRFYDSLYINETNLFVHSDYADGRAKMHISGEVCGNLHDAAGAGKLLIHARLTGKDGTVIEGNIPLTSLPVNGDSTAKFEMTLDVQKPHLWSPQSPNLYTLNLEIHKDGNKEPLSAIPPLTTGIRSIRFCPDNGFFINETPLKIKGVCVHHDAGCLGAAVWPDVWRRRLEKLREAGCNAVRCSHNPHMNELYDLCDEMGFLVMDEAFDEWEGHKNKWWQGHNVYPPKHQGYADDFPQWHEKDLADMVIRHRNHPSLIMWSIGNEIDYPNDPYAHPLFAEMTGNNDANKPQKERQYNSDKPNMERLTAIAAGLVKIVKKNDTTRPVLLAAAFPELSSQLGLLDVLDIAGYNYKEHLYEESHRRFPKLPLLGSENGHSVSAWKAVQDNEYISGQFLWTGIDYLGEAQGWPVRASGAGILDLAGNEKTAYFRRKALWSDKPFAYLVSRPQPDKTKQADEIHPWLLFRSWDYAPGETADVVCYTNLSSAELFCNGKSCGVAQLQKEYGYISWAVPFERGTLKVAGIVAGTDCNTSDVLESCLSPVRLQLKEWKSSATVEKAEPAGEYRIAQIEAEMLDEAGRLCTSAGQTVSVYVNGGGRILGMENGDIADCSEYSLPRRCLYKGKLVIFVLLPCACAEPVSITAQVEGLSPATVLIPALPGC